jgi:hypothetical protein
MRSASADGFTHVTIRTACRLWRSAAATSARMAKLVDARDLKSLDLTVLRVRTPLRAPLKTTAYRNVSHFISRNQSRALFSLPECLRIEIARATAALPDNYDSPLFDLVENNYRLALRTVGFCMSFPRTCCSISSTASLISAVWGFSVPSVPSSVISRPES